MEKSNKKAQIGLGLVRTVFLALLVLAVIGIAMILTVTTLRDVTDDIDRRTSTVTNISTITTLNDTVGTNITGTANLRNCLLTIDTMSVPEAFNGSCAFQVNAANFTVTDCSIEFDTDLDGVSAVCYNNTVVNVTGTFSNSGQEITDVSQNISEGVVEFFDDVPTIFAILVVVVIILAIGIIILVVNRFGGAGGGGGSSFAGGNAVTTGRKEDSTVMGV